MNKIKISDIVEATNGSLAFGSPDLEIDHIVIDSRQADKGALFVPIIGEKVDAHKFIDDVLKAGACTLSSKKDIKEGEGACIYVEDTLKALQNLASWYRNKFKVPIVGITGSVGKTTTKEMIACVLEKKYKVLKTFKNLNSQIGVPLMMFHIEDDTEICVIEMGISIPNEMDNLVKIVRPEKAVITNIGVSHIGNLGSRENICAEKGKIITCFDENGKLFVCGNGDGKDITKNNIPFEKCQGKCELVYYGTENECEYYAKDIRVEDGKQKFVYVYPGGQKEVELSLVGIHQVNNAIIALTLGLEYGVDLDDGIKALAAYMPLDMRGVIKETKDYHIIDDTYNASPDSIKSNLQGLFLRADGKTTIAILGDVLELGEQSKELHESIGEFIVAESEKGNKLSLLITIGEETKAIDSYVTEKSDIKAIHCQSQDQVIESIEKYGIKDSWVLVKGSRGMQMDKIVERLV